MWSKVAVGALVLIGLASRLLPATSAQAPGPATGKSVRARGGNVAKSATRAAQRGRLATSPEQITSTGWVDIAKRTYTGINDDRVFAVAAGVTFYGLLAVFPAITALISLFGLITDPVTISADINRLFAVLPGEAASIIGDQVKRIASAPDASLGLAFLFALGLALWTSTGGTKALIDALNVAYGETEKRSFVNLNVFALLATLGGIVGMGFLMTVVAVIPVAIAFMSLGALGEWLLWAGRWPAVLVALLLMLALVYRFGPSREHAKWRWVSPGSLVAAIGLVGFSMLFSWYAASFGKFNETYGSLGAVIAFMTWLWLSCVIVLVGAELNAETERQTFQDSTTGLPQPIGQRGANAADVKPA